MENHVISVRAIETSCRPVLTDIEASILADLVQGVTMKQIAHSRRIKLRTVSWHIACARVRLGAETRDQMIANFVIQYVIPLEKGL